ncbi:hypothetical protein DSCO28_54390 [Desulfosarcina ovata subsp. sediminis]|uniref:CHAT domain-containing protein n=1 Tax=Desulfosarcina ovata subsp. sediminis TaxID=885957 RepID=A0A5K7ZX90_9BACT|nr:CHAT domain-containing protein [Desulfosarcina ovata]BBO84873.1 hypothetical protein DSCO28_54390 [Desulfosarcina ovata subsp. sediminis]
MKSIIYDALIISFIAPLVILQFVGCQKSISVKDAQDLAIKFHGETHKRPPRRLGPKIEKIVEYYKKNKLSIYSPPKYSSLELDKIVDFYRNSNSGYFYLQEDARRCYFFGYMDKAIIFSKASLKAVPEKWLNAKAEVAFDLAMILAEAGDFISAERALDQARRNIYQASRRRYKEYRKAYKLKTSYLSHFSLASIKFSQGEMKEAEVFFYKALNDLKQIIYQPGINIRYSNQSYLLAHVKVGIAKSLLWQGKLIDAEAWARMSLDHGGHYYILPRIFVTLSRIFYEQGRFEDSQTLAKTVINMFTIERLSSGYSSTPGSLTLALAREASARAYLAMGDYGQALEQYNIIKEEMAADPETYERMFEGSIDQGMALFFTGQMQEAQDQFLLAHEKTKLQYGKSDYSVSEANALYALTLLDMGNDLEALKILDQFMMDFISHHRKELGATIGYFTRKIRLERILEGYIELLFKVGDNMSVGKAFEVAEVVRGHSVEKALLRSATRSVVGDPHLVTIIQQRQDLEMNITANQDRIAASMGIEDIKHRDKVIKDLKSKGDELINALHVLNKEIASRYPQYNKLVSPGSVSLEDVRKMLKKDEAILSIFTGQKASYVWAFGKTGKMAFSRVTFGVEALEQDIAKLRKSLTPRDIHDVEDIPVFDTQLSHKLYKTLLAPVRKGWEKARIIMIAANAPMDRLPLSLLISKPVGSIQHKAETWFSEYKTIPWLARTHAVTQLPSVGSIVYLRNRKSYNKVANTFVGFGDPCFAPVSSGKDEETSTFAQRGLHLRATPVAREENPSSFTHFMLPRLTETADEVRQIAIAVGADPEKDVYLGLDASEYRLKSIDLREKKILVFATHGLMPGDIDGLDQPALALSYPSQLSNENNDGLLTMGEIMWLKLNADWVVLSACNTAAAVGKGKEALSGLGQAFFHAGAKSLLVTSWPVETNSAKALTTGLFKYIAQNPEISRAEALRLSRLSLINDNGPGGFSYAHPIFWAPFILAGDGGGYQHK